MRNPLTWSAGFLIVGAAFGGRAAAHWRELTLFGPICGHATAPHCGWCYAAVGSLAASALLAWVWFKGQQTARPPLARAA